MSPTKEWHTDLKKQAKPWKQRLACRLTPPAGQPLKIIICRHALARLKINAYICRHDSGTSPAGAKGRAAKGRATQAKT